MNGTAWTIVGAQGLNSAGDQIVLIGLSWFLVRTYGSGFLGLTLAVWAITRGALLLWGGVVADRHDRRRISVVSGLFLSALILSVAWWDPSYEAGKWVWFAVAFGLGTLDGIRIPIAGSLIPFVVAQDQLVHANRWMQLRQWTLAAIGPTLGAFLMALGGIRMALAIAGLAYGFSALVMITIPPIPPVHDTRQSGWMDLRAGLRFVLTHQRLKVFLLTFATANFFVLGVLSVGIVAFARTVLHTGPLGLGILTGCFAAGLGARDSSRPVPPESNLPHAVLRICAVYGERRPARPRRIRPCHPCGRHHLWDERLLCWPPSDPVSDLVTSHPPGRFAGAG